MSEETIRYILSFVGGGIVSTVLTLINTARLARKQQEITHIREQLRSLYGPLNFFTIQNEKLNETSSKIHEAYKTEYIDKKWSK